MLGYLGAIAANDCRKGAVVAVANARALMESAVREIGVKRASLADYLRYVADEEIGKSLFLLEAWLLSTSPRWDAARGGWKEFWREFRDHRAKYDAASAQCLRSRLHPDRPKAVWYAAAPEVPAGREKDFRKPKPLVFVQKEANLYVEYNPDLDRGRFISPVEMDADEEWRKGIEYMVTEGQTTIALRTRMALLDHLDDAEVQKLAKETRTAFDSGDDANFAAMSGLLLLAGARATEWKQ